VDTARITGASWCSRVRGMLEARILGGGLLLREKAPGWCPDLWSRIYWYIAVGYRCILPYDRSFTERATSLGFNRDCMRIPTASADLRHLKRWRDISTARILRRTLFFDASIAWNWGGGRSALVCRHSMCPRRSAMITIALSKLTLACLLSLAT